MPENERCLVISDLHVRLGLCHWQDLKRIIQTQKIQTLIINGDLFGKKKNSKSSYKEFKEASQIIPFLARMKKESNIKVIFLRGNHDDADDPMVKKLLSPNSEKPYIIDSNGKQICIMHGHEFDDAEKVFDKITLMRRFSLVITNLYYQAIKKNGWLKDLAKKIQKKSALFNQGVRKIEQKAMAYARENGFDIIICGHTHQAKRITDGNVEYINCGCWIEDVCSYVIIDDHGIELININCKSP